MEQFCSAMKDSLRSISHHLSSDLIIHEVVHDSNIFHLYASSFLGYSIYPYCGHVSSQVNSRYS